MSTSSKNSDQGGKIAIGYIASAHGVRGEVRVVPLTDYPERFRGMDSLSLYSDEGLFVRNLPMKSFREDKGEMIVEGGLADRTEALGLVGLSILVEPEDRVPLPEGHFWVDDLIGLRVHSVQGEALGTVEAFLANNGNDVYAIRDFDGGLHYIPAVEPFIKDIDLSSGKMTVALIEGLWE